MSIGPSAEIGRLVRERRVQRGMTQDQLAHAIGCSKAQLSLMESGQRTVSLQRAARIEAALNITDGSIVAALQWQTMSPALRAQLTRSQTQSHALASRIKRALNSDDPIAELRAIVEQSAPKVDEPMSFGTAADHGIAPVAGALRRGIPVINKVAAGYPAEFTDLDYPASIADDYIFCPDVSDPDAFAARVVGDSMEPQYHEGDIVIFSPQLPTPTGSDCFVRLERDSQTTFKRVYFEDEGRTIRLQPLNNSYAPQLVNREDVGGLYAAAYVMRKVPLPQ